jgi:hypothetical protein
VLEQIAFTTFANYVDNAAHPDRRGVRGPTWRLEVVAGQLRCARTSRQLRRRSAQPRLDNDLLEILDGISRAERGSPGSRRVRRREVDADSSASTPPGDEVPTRAEIAPSARRRRARDVRTCAAGAPRRSLVLRQNAEPCDSRSLASGRLTGDPANVVEVGHRRSGYLSQAVRQ